MYKFSDKSLDILSKVHPDLQKVVKHALRISEVDFGVTSGIRTEEEQRKLVKKGASQTMDSRHLKGTAVDLTPYVNGSFTSEWKYFYPLAKAMQQAANELNISIRWGGCWSYINSKTGDPRKWVNDYVATGKKFIDGYHFDLG